MWGRFFIGTVFFVGTAVWLAAIWIVVFSPTGLPLWN
jgi:hypothetical protein